MATLPTVLELPGDLILPGELPREYKVGASTARRVFIEKLGLYGASWLVFRPTSITDQALIKAFRLRKLQAQEHASKVGEPLWVDAVALVNYSLMAVYVAHANPLGRWIGIPSEKAELQQIVGRIDALRLESARLFVAKDHDYDQAWRQFRVATLVDLVLAKFVRIRQLESTSRDYPAELVRPEFLDISNYACLLAGLLVPND